MTHTGAHPQAGGAARRKLPIGIRAFRKFRGEGRHYVDKTARARRLAGEGRHYVVAFEVEAG